MAAKPLLSPDPADQYVFGPNIRVSSPVRRSFFERLGESLYSYGKSGRTLPFRLAWKTSLPRWTVIRAGGRDPGVLLLHEYRYNSEERQLIRDNVALARRTVNDTLDVLGTPPHALGDNLSILLRHHFGIESEITQAHLDEIRNSVGKIADGLHSHDLRLKITDNLRFDSQGQTITDPEAQQGWRTPSQAYAGTLASRSQTVTVRLDTQAALTPGLGAHALINGVAINTASRGSNWYGLHPVHPQQSMKNSEFQKALNDPMAFSRFIRDLSVLRQNPHMDLSRLVPRETPDTQRTATGRDAPPKRGGPLREPSAQDFEKSKEFAPRRDSSASDRTAVTGLPDNNPFKRNQLNDLAARLNAATSLLARTAALMQEREMNPSRPLEDLNPAVETLHKDLKSFMAGTTGIERQPDVSKERKQHGRVEHAAMGR